MLCDCFYRNTTRNRLLLRGFSCKAIGNLAVTRTLVRHRQGTIAVSGNALVDVFTFTGATLHKPKTPLGIHWLF